MFLSISSLIVHDLNNFGNLLFKQTHNKYQIILTGSLYTNRRAYLASGVIVYIDNVMAFSLESGH